MKKKWTLPMTETPEHKLQKFVNSSGFPLQIGIKNLIETTYNYRKWRVVASEHPWHNKSSESGGFIDLILENENQTQSFILECKRVRDSEWLFLCPSANPNKRRHAKVWSSYGQSGDVKFFDWLDLNADPVSFESEFCLVPGQDAKSKPLLERTASELVDATESLAYEEASLKKDNYDKVNVYYPAIITTAELKICKFDPNKIAIASGEITECMFESVPFVRFRKSLTARPRENNQFQSISEVNKDNKRTVFVINANHLIDFLNEWELGDLPRNIFR